ncbi:MFS general substrate transporter [Pleurostoma richardsiae]|uniref:MFS general substrate transporter n=1 Tax=Pleurostoma richardsiae TaxID=41990 RepID=A0AA38RD71_9PEZI|nr:MFS general substrate transporter [Pleurostoma richardsiae]
MAEITSDKRPEAEETNASIIRGEVKQLSTSEAVDEALRDIVDLGGDVEVSEEESRRVLRKIDWALVPLMCILYIMQYLDKAALSWSAIMGIRIDNHMSIHQYAWLNTIFYLGYLVWLYPTSILLQRFPIAKYTSANVILWGIVLACHAATTNFAGLMAVRFFLGVLESTVTPSFVLITSKWYRTSESAFRISLWYGCNGMAQMIGSAMAYGIYQGENSHGYSIAPWKLLFLVLGCFTILIGVVFILIFPDSPREARFLKDHDKVLAIERLRFNQQGLGTRVFKRSQVMEACTDVRTYLYFLFALCATLPTAITSSFFSILIQDLGYSTSQSLLYGMPPGAVQLVLMPTFCWAADRFRQKCAIGIAGYVIPLVGAILMVALPKSKVTGQLVGNWLTACAPIGFAVVLSMVAGNTAGYTKKGVVNSVTMIGYCVGGMVGPQCMQASAAPRYVPGKIVLCVFYGIAALLIFIIRCINVAENRRRDRGRQELGDAYSRVENQEFLDLTDKENPDFRYIY